MASMRRQIKFMFGHFYWPDIDVDLDLKIIRHPERFPLQAKNHNANPKSPATTTR